VALPFDFCEQGSTREHNTATMRFLWFGWFLSPCSCISLTAMSPPIFQPSVSEAEQQMHSMPLISENTQTILGRTNSESDHMSHMDENFDVCEVSSNDGHCYAQRCAEDPGQTQAERLLHGKISRVRRGSIPKISGNSPGSYCAISHKYRFIFVHVLKNGGTSTKEFLKHALCKGADDWQDCDSQALALDNCQMLLSGYPSYFRWTWARSVSARAVSIYGMAKGYGMSKSISFEEFWLNDNRWSLTGLSPDHARPQSDFLQDSNGCLSLDFVGSLESAQIDMKTLIDTLDADDLRSYYDKNGFDRPTHGNVFGSAETATGHASAQEMVEASPRLREALTTIYKDDVEYIGL